MSVISLSSGDPTVTVEELHAAAKSNNFSIKSGSDNEATFIRFASSFDAVCEAINSLPEYEDPRASPVEVEGERTYYRPNPEENPLNAWMYRTHLKSRDPDAAKGPLAGKTIAIKDNMSVGGLPIGLGTSTSLFTQGRYAISAMFYSMKLPPAWLEVICIRPYVLEQLQGHRGLHIQSFDMLILTGKHPISPIDATVVRRILEAGGTIKGTATCENLSIFAASYTAATGVVHNAWLPDYATGGSSSGCGALISIPDVQGARYEGRDHGSYPLGEAVDLGVGGDQGGSIRLPAAYSGIYGLKPTHGLVPYTGIASLHPIMDHTGPMARTLEDIALLLGVLAGYDGMDPRMTPESPLRSQVPDYLGDLKTWVADKDSCGEWNHLTAAKGLRIGILKEAFEIARLDPSVEAALNAACNRFQELGAEVRDVSIPLHKQGAAIWTISTRPMISHFLQAKPPDLLAHTMPHVDLVPMGQEFYDALANRNAAPINMALNAYQMEQRYGNRLTRKSYMHIFELRAAYDKALEQVDVLLAPVTPTVGPKIPAGAFQTESNPNGDSDRILDLFEPIIGNTLNTAPFNVSGHPAMSMPVGWGKVKDGDAKLPVGLQLIAKRWDEASIFKAAKAWEMGGKWFDVPL